MLINAVIGAVLGYLAGLGIGGGTLLILWLTFVANMSQADARAINLMFFIVSAGAVSLIRLKKGSLHIKKILPAILSGCAAAGLFSYFSTILDVEKLQKLFGIILIASGLRELFYRPRELR